MKPLKCAGLLGLFFFVFNSPTFSDSWLNLYDIENPDYLRIAKAQDGIYIAGITTPQTGPRIFWILRINSQGNIVWKKNFLGPYAELPELLPFSIIALNDGSVLVWGTYFALPNNSAGQTAMKISDAGEIVWKRKYTGGGGYNEFQISTISENADGTFALMGSGLTGEYTLKPWFAKLAADGTIASQKVLDASVHQRGALTSLSIPNNYIIMAGTECQIQGSNCINPGAWVAKYNTSGASQWEKHIAIPILTHPLVHFIRETSGGFLVGIGNDQPFEPVSILVKLTSAGAFEWSKLIGPDPNNIFQFASTQDGGMIAMPWPFITLTKLTSSGTIQWDKHYDPLPGFYTWGYDIVEGSDGALYVAGPYSCDGGQTTAGLFVMKVSSSGDSCTASSTNTTSQSSQTFTVSTLAPPSETTSPMFTVQGEFTASDSSSTVTPICTGQLIGGQWIITNSPNSDTCGGPGLEFEIKDIDCGADEACKNQRKVLISKMDQTDTYPSTYQSEDRIIKIWGLAKDATGQPVGGQHVYLRIYDPPDSAPYVMPPNPYVPDNKGGLAVLTIPQGFADCTAPGGTICVVSEDQGADLGKVMVELEVTSQFAGDNYQIEASFSDFDPLEPSWKSGVVTAWKRVYVENDSMYRRGGILAESFNASTCGSNCNKIKVYGCWTPPGGQLTCETNVQLWDSIRIFDWDSVGETRTIVPPIIDNADFTKTLTLDHNLNNNYTASDRINNIPPYYPAFSNGHSAGIGVPAAGYYEALTGTVASQVNDAFVDVKIIAGNTVPYLAKAVFDRCFLPLIRFHQLWFEKKRPQGWQVPAKYTCQANTSVICPSCANTKQNFFHVIPGSYKTGYEGFSIPETDLSHVLIDVIQEQSNIYCSQPPPTPCNGNELPNYIKKATAHELVHQFWINKIRNIPNCDGLGHDHNIAWCGNAGGSCVSALQDCGGTTWCNMNNLTTPTSIALCQRIDGIDKLDCNDLAGIMCPGVLVDCSGNPPDSLRTHIDPE